MPQPPYEPKPEDRKDIERFKDRIKDAMLRPLKAVRVRKLRDRVRGRGDRVQRALFDAAVEELKAEGKLIVQPIMSKPGHRRFDKKTRRFTTEPWAVDYEYVYCESLLDSLAQASK